MLVDKFISRLCSKVIMEEPEVRARRAFDGFIQDRYLRLKVNYMSEEMLHNLLTSYLDDNKFKDYNQYERTLTWHMVFHRYSQDML